jgi:hypothetical protein
MCAGVTTNTRPPWWCASILASRVASLPVSTSRFVTDDLNVVLLLTVIFKDSLNCDNSYRCQKDVIKDIFSFVGLRLYFYTIYMGKNATSTVDVENSVRVNLKVRVGFIEGLIPKKVT